MKLILTNHAKKRMERRKISISQIIVTVSEPHFMLPARNHGTKRAIRNIGSKSLSVIYKPSGRDTIVVVTAAWLEPNDVERGRC